MKYFFSTLSLFLLMIPGTGWAQNDVGRFHVLGIGSLPLNGFGKKLGNHAQLTRRQGFDIGEGASLATPGFGLEAEYISVTGINGLGWVLNATFLINGVDGSEVASAFKRMYRDTMQVEFHSGNWVNIPIMTGFHYEVSVSEIISVYGTVQAGLNLVRAPSKRVVVSGVEAEKSNFDVSTHFAVGVGAGLVFNRTLHLELKFLDSGSPGFDGTRVLSKSVFPEIYEETTAILGERRPVSMFLLAVGVSF